ncbi:hypothetical protein HETIRDRAFT_456092 [Heterobasidion irregulare TC 32-1]|uniref:Uncharacterized protein n=1 Tax=Heterobasidion irregulare (strain TC 32-1) TaxID=747525 RepID=W4JPV3_HETIT|nr:uncharacterized protein HETIRDRAFT_456092 [Heterobasidion irregulare TC 32-1]ETW75499.1 hypothetical protein HETIRDRAFT_456092 [Heterobasidion irregulare TC 32-1]
MGCRGSWERRRDSVADAPVGAGPELPMWLGLVPVWSGVPCSLPIRPFSIVLCFRDKSLPMPSSLVDLLVSALSDLIDVSPEHPAELEDFMIWGQNFARTLASLEAIPSFAPSPQLALWLDSAEDTLETYVTDDWLAWGARILRTRATRRDERIQAEVAAAATAQAEVARVAEAEARRLADEERAARGVAEEARRRARDQEIMGLYVRGSISREESERRLAEPLETESGPSVVSAKDRVVGRDGDVEMAAPVLRTGDAIDSLRASTAALSVRGEGPVPSGTGLFLPDGEEEVVEVDRKGKRREVVDEEWKGKRRAPPARMSVKSPAQQKAEADREAEERAAKRQRKTDGRPIVPGQLPPGAQQAEPPCTYCSHFVTPFVCFRVLGDATHCLKCRRDRKSCDGPRRWTKLLSTPSDTVPLPLPSSPPPPIASSSSARFLPDDLRRPARRLARTARGELRTRRTVDRDIEILRWRMARTESEVRYLLSEHEARGTELAELERVRASLPEGSEDEDEDGEGSVELVLD